MACELVVTETFRICFGSLQESEIIDLVVAMSMASCVGCIGSSGWPRTSGNRFSDIWNPPNWVRLRVIFIRRMSVYFSIVNDGHKHQTRLLFGFLDVFFGPADWAIVFTFPIVCHV